MRGLQHASIPDKLPVIPLSLLENYKFETLQGTKNKYIAYTVRTSSL